MMDITGHGHMQTIPSTSLGVSGKNKDSRVLPARENMREEYHIKIEVSEKEQLDRTLKYLGIEPNFVAALNTGKGMTLDYMVSLSKYELLYLRLSCVTGKIVNVAEWRRNEKILHTDPEVS